MAQRGSAMKLALVSALLGARVALSIAAENDVYPEAARELAVVRAEQALEGGLKESPALRTMDDRRLSGAVNMNRHASTHLNYIDSSFPGIKTWYTELIPKHSSADTYFSVEGHKYGYFGLQQVEKAGATGFWFQGKIVFSIWDQGCDRDLGPCAADLGASQNPTYTTKVIQDRKSVQVLNNSQALRCIFQKTCKVCSA